MDDQADHGNEHNPDHNSDPDGPEVSGAELMASLAGLIDAVPADLPDATVSDGLIGLIKLAGCIDATVARFAAAFDAKTLGVIDGARSTGTWLAARTELSAPVAAGVVRTGRRLRACPHVDASARAGRLGRAKVAKLLEARKDVEDLFSAHEKALVEDVTPMTVARATLYIDEWRRIALATAGLDDGPEPAGDTGRNQLTITKSFQGRWLLNADLDAIGGEALKTTLEDWIDRRIKAGAIDPCDHRDRKSHRADALQALVGHAGDHDNETGTHQPRARINLSWDADDLLGKDIAELAELDQRRCNTTTGTTLAFAAADELMCNADVHDLLVRFGYDNTRTILGVTHTRRYPTDRERWALDQRDQGCVFPGCDAPTHWCHAHHITPYETGQTTQLDDLVLLCAHHHRAIHHNFTLTRNHQTGHITVTRPNSTPIQTGTGTGEGRRSPHPVNQGTKLPTRPSKHPTHHHPPHFKPPTRS